MVGEGAKSGKISESLRTGSMRSTQLRGRVGTAARQKL